MLDLQWVLGIKHRASGLYGKRSTNHVISPPPMSFFISIKIYLCLRIYFFSHLDHQRWRQDNQLLLVTCLAWYMWNLICTWNDNRNNYQLSHPYFMTPITLNALCVLILRVLYWMSHRFGKDWSCLPGICPYALSAFQWMDSLFPVHMPHRTSVPNQLWELIELRFSLLLLMEITL